MGTGGVDPAASAGAPMAGTARARSLQLSRSLRLLRRYHQRASVHAAYTGTVYQSRGSTVPHARCLEHVRYRARSHARSHFHPFSAKTEERAVPFHSGGKMHTSRSPGGTRFLARLAGSAIGLVLAATTAAAQTGVVSGTVIEASSGRGLPAVRIQIVGNESAAASSDANGRFLIRNAPAGASCPCVIPCHAPSAFARPFLPTLEVPVDSPRRQDRAKQSGGACAPE